MITKIENENNILKKPISIIYDEGCPACSIYVKITSIKKNYGDVHFLKARQNKELCLLLKKNGLDINKGMAVFFQDKIYFADDAIHILAILSAGKGFISNLTSFFFKYKFISKFSYPILVFLRNLLLKILGKKLIHF